jgi:hypothetical protein
MSGFVPAARRAGSLRAEARHRGGQTRGILGLSLSIERGIDIKPRHASFGQRVDHGRQGPPADG